MSDPLAQVVDLLQPDLSYCKFVEGAGAWRICREEDGRAFFCAMLDGTVQLHVPGQTPLFAQRGDFILLPAARHYAVASTEPLPADDRYMWPTEIGLNRFRLGDREGEPNVRMLVGYCAFGSTDAALLVSLLPSLIHARDGSRLMTLIQLAADEFRGGRAASEAILPRLMEVLFIEAMRASGPHCPCGVLRGLGDERVAVAIRQIHAEPTLPWTIASLARAAAMSRSAFFDRFRSTVGMAPMEYLLHWRMVLAKQLLTDRAASVAAVARSVVMARRAPSALRLHGTSACHRASTQGALVPND